MFKRPLRSHLQSKKRVQGASAEQLACKYLSQRGLKIIEQNYSTRRGEIDIIAKDKDSIVFVEVRLRSHNSFGGAAQSIDLRKQARLISAAQHYLQAKNLTDVQPCRFDAICLNSVDTGSASKQTQLGSIEVDWIQDAFRPQA